MRMAGRYSPTATHLPLLTYRYSPHLPLLTYHEPTMTSGLAVTKKEREFYRRRSMRKEKKEMNQDEKTAHHYIVFQGNMRPVKKN